MTTPIRSLFAALALLLAAPMAVAQVAAPTIAARSWLLLDVTSGQTLAASDPDTKVEPASLTKLMTAYLTFSALKAGTIKPDQVVPVSTRAWRMEGSRMFIEPNKPVTVDELIRGVIVQSGNDACVVLAEAISGSEEAFADMMTERARAIGLTQTTLRNSTGWPDPNHRMS